MSSFQVIRGNCPCSLKRARELRAGLDDAATEGDDHCLFGADGRCPMAEELAAHVPGIAAIGEEGERGRDVDRDDIVTIDPADLSELFGDDFGDMFLLVTSPDVRAQVRLENRARVPIDEISWRSPDTRSDLIKAFRELDREGKRCSALWIVSDEFEHYLEEDISNAKIAAVSFFSSPFSPGMLRRYMAVVRSTRYSEDVEVEARLIGILGEARRVIFQAPRYGVSASFDHHQTEHWFSLHGSLEFGQQTVLPTGELAVLADASGEFDPSTRFVVNGTMVLKGQPILHRGNRGVSRGDTAKTFAALASMQQDAVLVRVVDGFIEELSSPTAGENLLLRTMQSILDTEPRYRKLHEIGFGTNNGCSVISTDNFFANERCPGLHCGLGLGSYTPFHIDMACTEIEILAEYGDGELCNVYSELGLARGELGV